MRRIVLTSTGVVLFAAVALTGLSRSPASGDEAAVSPYTIDSEEPIRQNHDGITEITVRFTIRRQPGAPVEPGQDFEILIREEGKEVKREEIPQPKTSQELDVVLAVDIRGAMKGAGIAQTQKAAHVFFTKLPAQAEAGLLLFNDQIQATEALRLDRDSLVAKVMEAQPRGGSAWHDAIIKAVQLLEQAGHKHRAKAIVLTTNGVDLNSTNDLQAAIKAAQDQKVKVYPIGIGTPGKLENVTSILVLDKSGSMKEPASDTDKVSKIVALKGAAKRFLAFVHKPLVRTSILTFSDVPGTPGSFIDNKILLGGEIERINAQGETALFDSVYEGVEALVAERQKMSGSKKGRFVVVAMTDGIDNTSRRRVDEVIARAKQEGVKLYLVGFGRDEKDGKKELDEVVMTRMAKETGGQFYHARNQEKLMEIFESLSLELHNDGIDEDALRHLASETGGKYFPAKDVDKLDVIMNTVSQEILEKKYEVTFRSSFPDDGLQHPVTLAIVRRGTSDVAGPVATVFTQSRGLVVPDVNHFVYLGLLVVIGALIALPAGLKRFSRNGTA